MNESKRSRSGDRLSELPDSLIFHIFWFLWIGDVVRTTKLSKRWRNLWTTAPFLNFSDSISYSNYRANSTLDRVRNLFNRALLLWRGAKLLKFKVMFKCDLSIPFASDVDVWVRFAKEKEVEELDLDLRYPFRKDGRIYAEFGSLYSCPSLKVLSLKGCPFYIEDGNVKWDGLKSLTIDGACLDENEINKILCGSPKLEVFILALAVADSGENLCIQSSSLKKLSIRKYLTGLEADDTWSNIELKIRTPNLETLEISGLPYSKFSLKVSSLTNVTLGFCDQDMCESSSDDANKFVEEILKQIIPTIQDVESVTLSDWCLKVLGAMNKNSLLSPLSKVMFLKFNASFSKHEQIAGLLQIFPKLKRLVIENDYEDVASSEDENEDDYQGDGESLKFEANLPNSFLLQLRTVDITWDEKDKSIFSFIETLLKYASKLEKMVFRIKGFVRPSHPSISYPLFLASQKLLRMPRSSPAAQLIFCEY